eukprot:2572823-Rhodomonas_salina.2
MQQLRREMGRAHTGEGQEPWNEDATGARSAGIARKDDAGEASNSPLSATRVTAAFILPPGKGGRGVEA